MAQIDSPDMLNYLNALLKHGNYTKAAKDLYISQPYLTQTIQKIEQELNVEIINRRITPLQLTEAGELYYQYLNSLEVKQDQFRRQITRFNKVNQKIIRIGVLPSLGTYLLPLFLPDFIARHPEITIELHEALPKVNQERVIAGEIDFYLGQNPETAPPNLTIHQWGRHGYYAIIPKCSRFYSENKPILKAGSINVQQLLHEPLVLTSRGSAIRRQVDYLLLKYKIQPTIALESSDIFTVVELAKKMAITFVPKSVRVLPSSSDYNLYLLPEELISLDYFIAHAINRTLSSVEEELIDLFLKSLSQSDKKIGTYFTDADHKK